MKEEKKVKLVANNGKSKLNFKEVDSLTSKEYVEKRKKSMKKLEQDIKDAHREPDDIIVLH